MARERDHAPDVGLMDLLLGATTYIYVDIVLERWLKNSVSKNMSREENWNGHVGKRFNNNNE